MNHTSVLDFIIITLISLSAVRSQTTETQEGFKIYGFIRLNATYDFQDMKRSDLFKPSAILVPKENTRHSEFFMNVKQTRLGLEFNKNTTIGTVKAIVEIDFHDSANKIAGLARIRHAYFEWKYFTFGQTWSTFYDIEAKPHIVDFEGANSSTLNRVPLIRYKFPIKSSSLYVAVENPVEQITVTGDVSIKNQSMPDILSAYKIRWSTNNFIKLSGLVRQLSYVLVKDNIKNEVGWGTMVTGKINLFNTNNLKFQAVGGKGIARYIEGVRNLGYDGVFNKTTNKLETLSVVGGFLAYQHFWNEVFNSSLVIGSIQLETNDFLTSMDFASGDYSSLNLFYEPSKKMSFGVEYLYGKRENKNGNNANASRVQFAATLKF